MQPERCAVLTMAPGEQLGCMRLAIQSCPCRILTRLNYDFKNVINCGKYSISGHIMLCSHVKTSTLSLLMHTRVQT